MVHPNALRTHSVHELLSPPQSRDRVAEASCDHSKTGQGNKTYGCTSHRFHHWCIHYTGLQEDEYSAYQLMHHRIHHDGRRGRTHKFLPRESEGFLHPQHDAATLSFQFW